MNEKNLKRGNPNTQFRSGREAVENGKKGGKASGRTRSFKSRMKKICSLDVTDSDLKEMLIKNGVDETDYATAIMFMQVLKAANGDTKAYKAVMETLGETVRNEELALRKKELKVREAELKRAQDEKGTAASFENAIISAYEKRVNDDKQ